MVDIRKAAWVCIMCLFIFLSMLSLISNSIYADLITTVKADVNEDELAVDVSPGSTGTAIIQGNVTCQTTNPVTLVTVSLSATSTVGSAVISPGSMEFQGTQQSEDFQVIINVPLGTDASNEHVCTVSGT